MGTTMELVSGTTTIPISVGMGGIESPVKCKGYDLGFPEIREVVNEVAGDNGVSDDSVLFGARTVTLNLTVKDDRQGLFGGVSRHRILDMLRALCSPRRRSVLLVRCEGWEQERRMDLRASPMSCVVDQKGAVQIEATLTFQVPRGTMRSVARTTGTIFPTGLSAGLALPVLWGSTGVAFSPGSNASTATLTNLGTEAVQPLLRIYGRGRNPAIVNRTTGLRIAFATTIDNGHYLEVDLANKTAYLDSNPLQNYYGTLDLTQSTWWSLEEGENNVEFVIAEPDNSCQLYYDFASEWI